MFQSDDLNLELDEDFLCDAFDVPPSISNNEQIKRLCDEAGDQPMKKVCTKLPATKTEKILSLIRSKSQPEQKISPICTFTLPKNILRHTVPSINCSEISDINRRVVQRKFPGPAGILPEQRQPNLNSIALEESDTSKTKKLEPDVILCSQFTEDNFKKGPWQQMLADWSNNTYNINLPNKYTISWTKSKAVTKKLIGQKTPFLAAVIQSIDSSSKDPMILLKDKTDEIQATLFHEVWDEYFEFLRPGSVIVLKQVGVLSTLKKHYLSITLTNIITVYSEQESLVLENTFETRIINMQEIPISEILKTIENTKNNHQVVQKVVQTIQVTTTNPYFKTNDNKIDILPKVNNSFSFQNKTLQLISNIKATNAIKSNVNPKTTSSNNVQNKINDKSSSATQQQSNKFYISSNVKNVSEPNKENTERINTYLNSSSNSNINAEADEEILTQVLEGVDTASIFEDF